MRKSDVVTIKPIAVGFQEGRRIGGWGNTFFWGLLKSRKIESYLDGNRRKVVVASAEAYIAKKLAEDVFWTDCLFLWDEVLVLWPPITKLVLASERGESSTPQPAAASPAVPPLAATKEEAHASEVVGPAPALQASEGEGTRARDQRLWDRRKELREKEPAITDSEIARRICKEEAAKVKAAKGKEIAGEEAKKRKPPTESNVRRILVRMKKRPESQDPSNG